MSSDTQSVQMPSFTTWSADWYLFRSKQPSGRIDRNGFVDQFEAGFQDHPGIAPARGLELIKVEY